MISYKEYRPNIKSGDLLAWSTTTMKSFSDFYMQLVRFFTKSEYDHVGVAWVIGNRVFVIEAEPPLVRIFPLSKKSSFYHIPMKMDFTDDKLAYLLNTVGDPYSIPQAIKSYFGKPAKDNRWQCAELCLDFYEQFGINLGDGYTPSDVVQAALKNTGASMTYVNI